MIQYYHSSGKSPKATKIADLQEGSWVRVERPTPDEVASIITQFSLDPDIVTDALDPHEVPRVETVGDTLYFMSRLPDTDDDFNDFTTPILFIIKPKYIVTLSQESLSRLWQPFIDKTEIATTMQSRTMLQMLESIVFEYQSKVATINRQMRAATSDITRLRPGDISIFVEYERKLNDYLDALFPTNDIIERLLSGHLIKLFEDDRDLVEDLVIEFQQVITRSKSLLRTITNVRDSYRAVMDTRLNETIRLLTVITLALTIPTMLAGLYGMNVALPGDENSPAMFWIIALISLTTSGALSFYFLRKRA